MSGNLRIRRTFVEVKVPSDPGSAIGYSASPFNKIQLVPHDVLEEWDPKQGKDGEWVPVPVVEDSINHSEKVTNLSERIRPDVEAARLVRDEVRILENSLTMAKSLLRESRPFMQSPGHPNEIFTLLYRIDEFLKDK